MTTAVDRFSTRVFFFLGSYIYNYQFGFWTVRNITNIRTCNVTRRRCAMRVIRRWLLIFTKKGPAAAARHNRNNVPNMRRVVCDYRGEIMRPNSRWPFRLSSSMVTKKKKKSWTAFAPSCVIYYFETIIIVAVDGRIIRLGTARATSSIVFHRSDNEVTRS